MSINRRILFVHTFSLEFLGVGILSSVLKESGHKVDLLILHMHSLSEAIERAVEINPDYVCFSVLTNDIKYALEFAAGLRKKITAPFIWGGSHPTFFENFIEEDYVDIVVRGEGEHALPSLVENPDKHDIPGVNFSLKDGSVIRNDLPGLITDLDELPFPDREIYRESYPNIPFPSVPVMVGRGCPHRCTFCYNDTYQELYRDNVRSGTYMRYRSPENVIAELEQYNSNYGKPKFFRFFDDTFLFNKEWLFKFLPLYKEHINVPFSCLTRANQMTEEIGAALKDANCKVVCWAIESGSEKLRNEVLNKRITDEQIFKCADILRRNNIESRPYNMFGLPNETYEDAMLTVEINRKVGNKYPSGTIFEPYEGTQIYEKYKHLINKTQSQRTDYTSHGKGWFDIDPRVYRIYRLFFFFVRFPFLHKCLVKWIERDHSLINSFLFWMSYGFVFWRGYNYSLREILHLFMRSFFKLR